jgi:YD repeat-containing protein
MAYVLPGGGDAVARDGLEIPTHDYIVNTYDGANNMLTSTFKRGGASGRTVATLTMTYDANSNLLTVTRS